MAEPDDVDDVVLDELPFEELPFEEPFESEPDDEGDEESELLLAGSFAFSFEAPFDPERLSVL